MLLLISGLLIITLGAVLLLWPEKSTKGEGDIFKNYEEKMGAHDQYMDDRHADESIKQIKGGAVVMIGPIPLVVGSDPRTALIMMLIALLIMSIWSLAMLQ